MFCSHQNVHFTKSHYLYINLKNRASVTSHGVTMQQGFSSLALLTLDQIILCCGDFWLAASLISNALVWQPSQMSTGGKITPNGNALPPRPFLPPYTSRIIPSESVWPHLRVCFQESHTSNLKHRALLGCSRFPCRCLLCCWNLVFLGCLWS